MCEVFGGVTGHRLAPMQSSGRVVTFPSKEEADKEVKEIKSNLSPFSTARFNYWSEEST
jgi:hypothetical protein